MSIDSKGQLIIADRNNQQIKKIALNATPNFYTSLPISTYATYMSTASTQSSGLTAEDDRIITEKLLLANQTGLIARTYQAPNSNVPPRDIGGLNLCAVGAAKTAELDKNIGLPIGGGCDNKYYLISYKGYITFPNAGKSGGRRFYVSAPGGVYVKIGDKNVIDKWAESGGTDAWPFDKYGDFAAEGGKQYPIEILYFKNLSVSSSKGLKLFWSQDENPSSSKTELIPEKYLSPSKSASEFILAPVSPTTPRVSINLNFINIKVTVPENATSVILFAPEFGVTKAKPLVGKIKSSLASFEVAVSSKFAGKKGILQLITSNAAGESKPLKVPVTVPKVVTKPAPKVIPIAKPKTQPTVNCVKGSVKRSFDGTACPPGYTRG
jgi:hypothetical protein